MQRRLYLIGGWWFETCKTTSEDLRAVGVTADPLLNANSYTGPLLQPPPVGSVRVLAPHGMPTSIFALGSFGNYTCMKPSKRGLKPKYKSAFAFMPDELRNVTRVAVGQVTLHTSIYFVATESLSLTGNHTVPQNFLVSRCLHLHLCHNRYGTAQMPPKIHQITNQYLQKSLYIVAQSVKKKKEVLTRPAIGVESLFTLFIMPGFNLLIKLHMVKKNKKQTRTRITTLSLVT